MKMIPLSEGAFTIDKSKVFVPFNLGVDELSNRQPGSLLVDIQPFLIITNNDILLLDTGLGFERNGTLQLLDNLKQHNVHPDQVTKVLLSHLHKDHAGGISHKNVLGHSELSFKNATYYVQRAEFDYAIEKGSPSYILEEISCLAHSDQVNWLDGDGYIDDYIEYKITGGHSPYHQVFWIKDTYNKKITFFGSDDAPQLQQMKNKFIAKYDYNGKLCMELRQEWWKEGQINGWTFLFYHDIQAPVYDFSSGFML